MTDQPTGITYELRTVADFLAVPEDRRAVCLKEFQVWLSMADTVRQLADLLPHIAHAEMGTECFRWVDDGLGEARITVEVRGPLEAKGDA